MDIRDNGSWIKNVGCPDCKSSDNLSLYEKPDGTVDGFCQTPNCKPRQYKSHNRLAASYLGVELGIKKITSKTTSSRTRGTNKNEESKVISRGKKKKEKKVAITKEEVQQVFSDSSKSGGGYRKIKDKYNEFLGIRTTFDDDGAAKYRWYPSTRGLGKSGKPKLVSYKQRICATKKFFHTGDTSWENDLFNQANCKGSGKFILIVGGEEDVAASVHMIEEYRAKRGKDKIAPIDVVSSIIGEGTVVKQCQLHYDFLDGYDNIIVAMDMDSAGDDAVEELLKVLPFQKVKIMQQPTGCKDPCDALVGGKDAEWIREFYNADKPKLTGIVSSSELHDNIGNREYKDLIPLPPILRKANEMLLGGLPSDEITNILAGSGTGKSTIVDEFIYHWIMYSTKKITILSFESGSDKYSDKLISRHLGINISRIVDRDEDGAVLPTKRKKEEFLARESTKESTKDLFYRNGEDAFYLIENRDVMCDSSAIKNLIMKAITHGGSDVIIIDPIQDLLDSMRVEDQAEFCSWLKGIKKLAAIVLVNHARKGSTGQKSAARGAELDEQDMQGTSALYKSGGVNIVLSRDKEHEDLVEKNTTKVRITKNRDGSDTGRADDLYYEVVTHTLHNKDSWVESQIEDL